MAKKTKISKVKNSAVNPPGSLFGFNGALAPRETNPKALINYPAKVQLARIRQDILLWREAIIEAENAWYPHRVKMQQLYYDTINDAHVSACLRKRRNMTLLKDFRIVDQSGEEKEELTKLFKHSWFGSCLSYILDSQFYGYSLIQLGDIVNGTFDKTQVLKRHHISPDRENYVPYIYALSGINFLEEEFAKWSLWVPTPTEIGVSQCGYGLLYKVSYMAIFIRNTIGYNGDFVELYSQPIRIGKTNKTEESERNQFEASLRDMGSSGYIMIDLNGDEVELMESALGGTGYKGYESFQKRMEASVSKELLGHADALDSTPGKLGSSGEMSPAQQAMEEIQITDNRFCEEVINTQLIPKMQDLGIAIPEGYRFEFKNDHEKEEFREREDASNQKTADILKTLSEAGYEVEDMKYIIDRTGIPVKKKEVVAPEPSGPELSKSIQNKLELIYV